MCEKKYNIRTEHRMRIHYIGPTAYRNPWLPSVSTFYCDVHAKLVNLHGNLWAGMGTWKEEGESRELFIENDHIFWIRFLTLFFIPLLSVTLIDEKT